MKFRLNYRQDVLPQLPSLIWLAIALCIAFFPKYYMLAGWAMFMAGWNQPVRWLRWFTYGAYLVFGLAHVYFEFYL